MRRGTIVGLILLIGLPLIRLAPATAQDEIWRPAPGTSIQLQYTGEPIDFSVAAEIYNLDLFETEPSQIAMLHTAGRRVICYMSVGTLEDWRPDAAQFPAAAIGRNYDAWPGERWLDLRALDSLGPILEARLDLARAKGCDGVDPDNLDGFETDSGFLLSSADTIRFLRWLSTEARARGLAIGIKNGADLLPELLPDIGAVVDWALVEDCHDQGWCDAMQPVVDAGLAVFQVEYTDRRLDWAGTCDAARRRGFVAIRKHRALDAFRETCP